MPRFTRRVCLINGLSAPNDWEILRDGVPIGRVLLYDHMPLWVEDRWSWSLTYPLSARGARGRSRTIEDALDAIKAASMQWEP